MKARNACALAGVALAAGVVVFSHALKSSNDAQAPAVARRMAAAAPVAPGALAARMALDWRPGGRVMQGPPLAVLAATSPDAPADGVAVTKALFAQRGLAVPPVGTPLTLVGSKGAWKTKIAKIIDWDRPARGWPNIFAGAAAAKAIGEDWRPFEAPPPEVIAKAFASDAGRHFDYAGALLLWAAALAAACMLANTMLLSVEARRAEIATARVLGATRFWTARMVAREAFALAAAGAAAGVAAGLAAAWIYVACDKALFPEGFAAPWKTVAAVAAATPFAAAAAALAALRGVLGVSPAEAARGRAPRKRTAGMLLQTAFGFGAFVAVEVWGASLMVPFVPSPEWPDAIVSILPGGVSSFDIAKLKNIEGVARIAELQPLQANFLPLEELPAPPRAAPRGLSPRAQYRNALLLASDWLPDFRFVAGTREEALAALRAGDACIATEMAARAHGWKKGSRIRLDAGRGAAAELEVAGIVDLNWHMVTSRGLLRGLNRAPVHTDGPLFTSFDTLAAIDPRPQHYVPMTHVWLSFDKGFLAADGAFAAGRKVEKAIAEALGEDGARNAVRLHSRDEVADGTLSHGARLIGSMARVPFVFIVVASLGFIAMLAASADARGREFAVAHALGATRPRITAMLAADAARVAAGGMALGLAGGALSGWLFTFATRKTMAGWGLPASFEIPWGPVGAGAAAAMCCALAVAVPAAAAIVRRKLCR